MSEKLVRLWEEAKDNDKTVKEFEEDLRELNEEIDWCVHQMFPDLVSEEECGCDRCSSDNND